MSARLPNEEEKEIARVFLKAMGLLSASSPLRDELHQAAKARVTGGEPVSGEDELLTRARQVIEAAGS